MVEAVRNWTINIVTLVLIIVLLEILVPSGKIKKFVDLISGFILLIAIINPVISVFSRGINLQDFQFVSSNFLDIKSIEADSKHLEEKQMQQIVKNYRDKIIRHIEDNAKQVAGVTEAKADIIINEDYKSKEFGQVSRVYVNLIPVIDSSEARPVTNIEKVKVRVGEDKKEIEKEAVNKKAQKLKDEVESKVADLLKVSKDNIVVSIVES